MTSRKDLIDSLRLIFAAERNESLVSAAWDRVVTAYTHETGYSSGGIAVLDSDPDGPKFSDDRQFLNWVEPLMTEIGYPKRTGRRFWRGK